MSLDKSSLSEWQASVLARLAACNGDQANLTPLGLAYAKNQQQEESQA